MAIGFNRFGVPLVSNPSLRSFSAHSMPTILPIQRTNPALTPIAYLIVQRMVARGAGGGGGGGGGSKFKHVFLHQ